MVKPNFDKVKKDLGSRVISIIESDVQAKKLLKKLTNWLSKTDQISEEIACKLLENAYAGYVLSSSNSSITGYDPLDRLEKYVNSTIFGIKHNPYLAGVPELCYDVFNKSFK